VAGRVAGRRDAAFDPAPDFDALWARNTVATSSVVVRRAAFLAAGGMAPHLPPCEDYNLWLRLAATGWRVGIVDAPVVIYSPTDESLTRNLIRFADRERACIEDIGAAFGLPEDRIHRRVAGAYHAHGRAALHIRTCGRRAGCCWRRCGTARPPAARSNLAAAAMPPAMLNLRRRLVHRA